MTQSAVVVPLGFPALTVILCCPEGKDRPGIVAVTTFPFMDAVTNPELSQVQK